MTKWILLLCSVTALWAAAPDPATQKEVLAASDALTKAMIAKDIPTITKLLHDDLTYSHSAAMNQSKDDVIKGFVDGRTNVEAIDFKNPTVRTYGNIGLIRSDVDMTNNMRGTSTTSHINVLFVWIKTPGGWQLVARQATAIPQPGEKKK